MARAFRIPRCNGCGQPHTRKQYLVVPDRSGGYVQEVPPGFVSTGDQEIVEGYRDEYDFCDACRATIPDHASISREARITAAVDWPY